MSEESRLTRTIVALIQETQSGSLAWRAIDTPEDLTKGTDDVVEVVFWSSRAGRNLRLFPYKTKFFADEDEWSWVDEVALEVSDVSGGSWWRFPKNRIIWDLLEAVKFKTIRVDSFIDSILSEHKEKT